MINDELLRTTLEWATEQHHKRQQGLPSEWRQWTWLTRTECGTACCIAGKVSLDRGWEPRWSASGAVWDVMVRDGVVGFPWGIAESALGLTGLQANRLFAGNNSICDLWRIANELTDGRIEIPAEFL